MCRALYLAVMLIFCGTACVSQLNEGIASFKMQNYRQAFIRLKPEAAKGQPDAQYAIGYMYFYGQGVIENHKKACCWIKKAAVSGQPDALVAMKILAKDPKCMGTLIDD